VLDGGAWLKPRQVPYTPGKRCGTYCIGGCVSPRANMDGCGKSHIRSPDYPASSKLLYRLSYPDSESCFTDYINSLIPALFAPRTFSLPIWSIETLIRKLKKYSGKLLCLSSAYLQKHTKGWNTKWGIQRGKCSYSENTASNKHLILRCFHNNNNNNRHQPICKDHTRNAYKESFQKNWTEFSRTCFPLWPATLLISHTNVE